MRPPKIEAKLIRDTSKLPVRGTDGSAGYDFHADIDESVVIPAGGDALIPLGIAMEIPFGIGLFLWPRSGMDAKSKIGKHAGLIDSDYRGEIHAALHNRGDQDYEVKPGDRVVQGVFQRYELFDFELVDDLDDSDRGACGFGSTGK